MTVPTITGGQVFQFKYFMLRLRIADEPQVLPKLAGVVERLGSGERRDFSSSEELVSVMETWDADPRPPQAAEDAAARQLADAPETEPGAPSPEAGNATT